MKKTTNIIASASLLTIMILSLGAAFVMSNNKVETPAFATYTNGDAATYYNTIDSTQSGNTLLTALRTLNLSKRESTVGYSSMGTTPSGQFKYTDYDPDTVQYDSNGQPYGTKISSFYTYTSTTSWNREHVWPNSHGGGEKGDVEAPYADADIHMPRPTISSENSSRGNSFFVEGMNHNSNGWDPYTAGYDANSRGEAARITFYCTLVNAKLILAPNNTTPSGTDSVTGQSFGSGHTMGNLETLIKWNINYPVNQREKNRNEGAEYLQGNRNPFIDHPEYACKIWGNVNNNIKTMCASASWDTGPSVTLSKSSASLTVDDTTTINATSSDGSTITWKSNDTTVVEVSSSSSASGANVTLTAVGAGTTTVTAKATINSTVYSATCSVTVTSSGSEGGGGEESDGFTIQVSEIPSQYSSTSFTSNSISFGCSNIGNSYSSGNMQFKSGSGYLYNSGAISNISGIKVCSPSSGSFSGTVYVGSSSHPTSGTSYSVTDGTTVNISGSPSYFTLQAGTVSGGAKCGNIIIYRSSGSTEKTLSSIAVSTAPSKTSYTAGEYFSPTGLVITRNYSDSTSDTYAYAGHTSEFSFTPSTSTALTTSNTSVTIGYGGKSCSQAITVTAASKTLSSISISGSYKTSFTVGDTFTFGGTVTANFSDSTTQNVTSSATFSGYNMSSAGNQTVTVSYTYGGTTKTTSYSITVASSGGTSSETTYNLVTDGLSAGDKVVIVAQANRTATTGYALTSTLKNSYYLTPTNATMSSQKLTLTSSMEVWTVGVSDGKYSFCATSGTKYLQGYTANGYKDLGLPATATDGTYWTVSENSAGTGYDMYTTYSSTNIYLEYYSTKGSFSAYSASATDYVLNFYRETTSSVGETAATWGTAFLSTISCDATGTNAPSTSAWATMKSQYEVLSGAEKTNVASATPSESGTDLQKAIARYVYIVNKYTNRTNYPDYLSKASATNSINPLSTNDTIMIIFVVLSASIIISSGLVIYHLSRKKKNSK